MSEVFGNRVRDRLQVLTVVFEQLLKHARGPCYLASRARKPSESYLSMRGS